MEMPDPKMLKIQFFQQRKQSNQVTQLDLLAEPESSRGLGGVDEYLLEDRSLHRSRWNWHR